MHARYSAKLYFDDDLIKQQDGDDVAKLQIWLIAQAEGKMGNLNGKIIDNETKKVIKCVQHAAPDC
jgi:hypothetical protein